MALSMAQTDALRARLDAELHQADTDVEQLGADITALSQEQAAESAGLGNHLADDASDVVEQEKSLTIQMSLDERRRDIRDALQRISDGVYGVCEHCHGAIAPERLEAMPWARLCISCKSKDDQLRMV